MVLMHPVTLQQVSLSAVSISLVWHERLQVEQAYSAVEQQSANAVAQTADGTAPHLEFTSLRRMLLWVLILAFVFIRCFLNARVLSNETPRYTGLQ